MGALLNSKSQKNGRKVSPIDKNVIVVTLERERGIRQWYRTEPQILTN